MVPEVQVSGSSGLAATPPQGRRSAAFSPPRRIPEMSGVGLRVIPEVSGSPVHQRAQRRPHLMLHVPSGYFALGNWIRVEAASYAICACRSRSLPSLARRTSWWS